MALPGSTAPEPRLGGVFLCSRITWLLRKRRVLIDALADAAEGFERFVGISATATLPSASIRRVRHRIVRELKSPAAGRAKKIEGVPLDEGGWSGRCASRCNQSIDFFWVVTCISENLSRMFSDAGSGARRGEGEAGKGCWHRW